jgi:hypothetical protein
VAYFTLHLLSQNLGLEDENLRRANLLAEVRRQVNAVRSKCVYFRIARFTLSFIDLYSIFCTVQDR